MRAKDFFKLLLPPICGVIKNKIFPKYQPKIEPIPKREREGDKMIVIGNGPSLNMTIEKYLDVLQQSECTMVNESCLTPQYEVIKPAVYVLADPVYFTEDNSMPYSQIGEEVMKALFSKTSWHMALVVPKFAKRYNMIEHLKKNAYIDVLFYEDGWLVPDGISQLEAWDKNIVCPPGQTVLNTAVWSSIYWGYPETYLIGADTSFLADLRVDQETNVLYTIDTHFYDNNEVYGNFYDSKKMRRPVGTNLYQELFSIGTALKAYWDLREYADWKGVKVYNASEYSWIDAFERRKLK